MAYRSLLEWKGDLGFPPQNMSLSSVSPVTDLGDWIDFVDFIEDYSSCNAAYGSFIDYVELDPTAPGLGANVDYKAIIYFRDESLSKTRRFTFPSPVPGIVGDLPQGTRITSAAVAAIVAALATVMGLPLTPLYGVVFQRN